MAEARMAIEISLAADRSAAEGRRVYTS